MSTYNYKPGLGNAASFQVSGIPYVTGGIDLSAGGVTSLDFPLVSNWIVVSNNSTGGTIQIGFSSRGTLNTNKLTLAAGSISPKLEIKATQLHLSGTTDSDNVSVMAGLTGIETVNIDNISVSPSGSNWSGSLNALVG